jgi:hypothetical protein
MQNGVSCSCLLFLGASIASRRYAPRLIARRVCPSTQASSQFPDTSGAEWKKGRHHMCQVTCSTCELWPRGRTGSERVNSTPLSNVQEDIPPWRISLTSWPLIRLNTRAKPSSPPATIRFWDGNGLVWRMRFVSMGYKNV